MWLTAHPFDPWGSKTGGIETYVRLMLAHAPEDASLGVIGVTEDPSVRPLHQWLELPFANRTLHFYAVAEDLEPNRRRWVPLSFRFAMAIRLRQLHRRDANWIAHRMDIAWMLGRQANPVLFVHSDPREWTSGASEVRWRMFPWLYRWMEADAIRVIQRMYCVNRTAVEWYTEQYPAQRDRAEWVPTTFDASVFSALSDDEARVQKQALVEPLGWSNDDPVVLFAGRLERQKNPLLALEAFANAVEASPDARLVVLGDGAERAALEAFVEREGVENNVVLLGAQPSDVVARWLQVADAFLMASRYEGMPISMLEALACGVPVVATAVGEIPSVVDSGCGIIIHEHDSKTLADALRQVLSQPERFPKDACVGAAQRYAPQTVFADLWQSMRADR